MSLQMVYTNGERLSQFPAFALAATSKNSHAPALVTANPF
jgi:hypothetical protein